MQPPKIPAKRGHRPTIVIPAEVHTDTLRAAGIVAIARYGRQKKGDLTDYICETLRLRNKEVMKVQAIRERLQEEPH